MSDREPRGEKISFTLVPSSISDKAMRVILHAEVDSGESDESNCSPCAYAGGPAIRPGLDVVKAL